MLYILDRHVICSFAIDSFHISFSKKVMDTKQVNNINQNSSYNDKK